MRMLQIQVSVLSLLLIMAGSASAQDDDWRDWPTGGRLSIGLAYFSPDLDTRIVVTDEDLNVGAGISFEQSLGLDDNKSTIMPGVNWRMFKRHELDYRYFELNRSATVSRSTVTISVGDNFYDVTLPIQSFFDISAHEIAYSYSVLLDERKRLYVGLGISLQDLALGIQGTASSPNPGEPLSTNLASTAPLPTVNIGFEYAFTDKWLFLTRLGWFGVDASFDSGEDLSGEIISANAGIKWDTFENVSFFLAYQLFDVDVDYLDQNVRYAITYNYAGPVLGVAVNF
ncbi:MAG: hypothetical protein GWP62_03675 [Gammaproteobacteria bacterium]|nr:hypothetical protein [Gammaproteobacteria bacterium]